MPFLRAIPPRVLSCSTCTRAEFLFTGTITQDLGRQAGLITVTDIPAVLNWQRVTYLLMATTKSLRAIPKIGQSERGTREKSNACIEARHSGGIARQSRRNRVRRRIVTRRVRCAPRVARERERKMKRLSEKNGILR